MIFKESWKITLKCIGVLSKCKMCKTVKTIQHFKYVDLKKKKKKKKKLKSARQVNQNCFFKFFFLFVKRDLLGLSLPRRNVLIEI